MTDALKPCPFCGGPGEIVSWEGGPAAGCHSDECEAQSFTFYLTPEIWNTRPLEDTLRDEITELRAENDGLIVACGATEIERVALEGELDALKSAFGAVADENTRLRAMLKKLEWERWILSWLMAVPEKACPICGGYKRTGHKSDCELAALLVEGA